MIFNSWLHHNPNILPNPVPPGYKVMIIDNDDNLLKGWSEEFDWSWKVDPLGNISNNLENSWFYSLKRNGNGFYSCFCGSTNLYRWSSCSICWLFYITNWNTYK